MPVAVARDLVQVTLTAVPVIVLNTTEEPVALYREMELATLQEVDEPAKCVVGAVDEGQPTAVEPRKQEMLWNLVEGTSPDLSPSEKDLFYHLLLSYADVLAHSKSDLGRTSILKHHIPTGNAPPHSPSCPLHLPTQAPGGPTVAQPDARRRSSRAFDKSMGVANRTGPKERWI